MKSNDRVTTICEQRRQPGLGSSGVLRAAILTLPIFAYLSCAGKTCVFQHGETGFYGEQVVYRWSNAKNWVDGQVPESGDSVYVTNMTYTNLVQDIPNLSLSHLEYVCSNGGKSGQNCGTIIGQSSITLTGTDNIISNVTAALYDYGTYNIAAGAVLRYCGTATAMASKDGVWSGAGELRVRMSGSSPSFYYAYYHPNFTGTVNMYRAGIMYFGGNNNNLYGFPNARINVYGTYAAEGTQSSFNNGTRQNARLFGEYHFYHKAGFTAQQHSIFEGDVYLHADAANDAFSFSPYHHPAEDFGIVFNGKVYKTPDGIQAKLYHSTYGSKTGLNDMILEFNGGGEFGALGIQPSFQQGGTGAFIRVGAPITMTSGTFLTFENAVRLYTTAPNVLPSSAALALGKTSADTRGVLMDLMGNDQKIGVLYYYGPGDGHVLEAVFTSSGGPATLDAAVNADAAKYRNLPTLDGQISVTIRGSSANAGAYNHMTGDTTGWIKSAGWASFVCSNSLPNVAGFEMVGNGVLYLKSDATLNQAMQLNLHDLTNGNVRVQTGSNRNVSRVLYNLADVAAGVYCRAGAGVEGANEAAWMGGDANYNGTITVAAHDPLYVWTGKGADGSLATGANWAGGAAPDISSATTTIDFRYASAEKPVTLSGSVAPACAIADATPFDKGALAFDGDGALELSGSGVVTNGWAFTDHASLVWNGPGTLVLTGPSSTSGTVSVVAGKVVLAAGRWLGGASISSGAELEVESQCGAVVFGADDPNENLANLAVDGMLTLGDGVTAFARSMTVGGARARGRRTYGSSSSAARITDNAHFGGAGTAMSIFKDGFILCIE